MPLAVADIVIRLGAAVLLCSLIGLEREWRNKSAGLRTQTLVGLGAALIMITSKYAFFDVVNGTTIILDPSRVAAQIVSGIGFIGGGLIFVRRDAVKGLTTAAIVWLDAAVGMTCGAGLVPVAMIATAAHLIVVLVYPPIERRVIRGAPRTNELMLSYEDGRGILSRTLQLCTAQGFVIEQLRAETPELGTGRASVHLALRSRHPIEELIGHLAAIDGVVTVSSIDRTETAD